MKARRIERIFVRNFKGISHAVFNLGQVTFLRGGNGVGKSSFLEAVKAAFQGGYDGGLVNDPSAQGAASITVGEMPTGTKAIPQTKAIIELTFDDGSKVKRIIDRESRTSSVECFSSKGEKLGGQNYVDEMLADADFVDPLEFLRVDRKKRAEVIKRLIDVPLSEDELSFVPDGIRAFMRDRKGARLSCFEALKAVEAAAVERRRAVNVDMKSKGNAIDELRQSIPTLNEESRDFEAESRAADVAHQAALTSLNAEMIRVAEQASAERRAAQEKRLSDIQANNAWMDAEVQRLKAEHGRKSAEIEQAFADQKTSITEAEKAALEQIEAELRPGVESAARVAEVARHMLSGFHKASGAKSALAKFEAEYRMMLRDSEHLDSVVERIRGLTREKMDQIPIPGISVVDGEVQFEGLPLDAINRAQQVTVTARLLDQAKNKVPLMIIDNIEQLDQEVRDEFIGALRNGGYQVVVAQVTEGPLRLVAQ